MENNGYVSVIVPIYNAENTLERCLESITKQTYKKLEIMLINDGSIDHSYSICLKFKKIDSRIKLINQQNLGAAAARNTGLDSCKGEYIFFVDADDTIELDVIAQLVNTNMTFNADIVACNIRVIFSYKKFYPYSKGQDIFINEKKEILKNYLTFQISPAIWGKLYKKKYVDGIRFKEISINEDFIFSWEVFKQVGTFVQLEAVHYNYFADTENSLTKTGFSQNNMSIFEHAENVLNDVNMMTHEMDDKLLTAGINYRNACIFHNLLLYLDYLRKITSYDKKYLDEKALMVAALEGMDFVEYGLLDYEANIKIVEVIEEIERITEEKR